MIPGMKRIRKKFFSDPLHPAFFRVIRVPLRLKLATSEVRLSANLRIAAASDPSARTTVMSCYYRTHPTETPTRMLYPAWAPAATPRPRTK